MDENTLDGPDAGENAVCTVRCESSSPSENPTANDKLSIHSRNRDHQASRTPDPEYHSRFVCGLLPLRISPPQGSIGYGRSHPVNSIVGRRGRRMLGRRGSGEGDVVERLAFLWQQVPAACLSKLTQPLGTAHAPRRLSVLGVVKRF